MKRVLIAVAMIAVLASVSAESAPTVVWGSDYAFTFTGAPDCVDRFGATIPKTSNWAVELINAANTQTLFTATAPGGGIGFWELYDTHGVGYEGVAALDAWNGMTVFTRVWEAPTAGGSIWYADTPNHLLSWSDVPTPATSVDYNFGEITQPMWVPEPGTGILVLAGAALMIFRRRRTEA